VLHTWKCRYVEKTTGMAVGKSERSLADARNKPLFVLVGGRYLLFKQPVLRGLRLQLLVKAFAAPRCQKSTVETTTSSLSDCLSTGFIYVVKMS